MNSTKKVPQHPDNSSRLQSRLTHEHNFPYFNQPACKRSVQYFEEFYIDPKRSASVRIVTVNYLEMKFDEKEVPMEVGKDPTAHRSDWRSLRLKNPDPKGPKQRLSQKSENALSSTKRVYLCIVPLVLLIVTVLYSLYEDVSKGVAITDLKEDLFDNIFEQELPVKTLVRSVEQYPLWPKKVKVLAFSGTRGVGKTYLANIARKHFNNNCVKDVSIKQLAETRARKSVTASLSNHCLNLVIIDDLEFEHNRYLFKFMDVIPVDRRVLIIAIYNLYSDDDNLNIVSTLGDAVFIEDDYKQSGFYYELLTFQKFNSTQVKRWILQQLQAMNVTRGSQGRIVEDVLLGHDVDRNGLKGLHSKLLIEVQKEKNL